MSFLKRLFGGSAPEASAAPRRGEPETYKGYTLTPEPMEEGGQYRLAGLIEAEGEAGPRRHHLVRADMLPTFEAASADFLRKARRVIDEQGEGLFGSH